MSSEHRLSDLLRDRPDEVGVSRVAQRLASSVRAMPQRRAQRARRRALVGVALVLLVGGASTWALVGAERPAESGPLFVDGTPPSTFGAVHADALEALELTDGSLVVLAARTELEVHENSGDRVALGIARGTALFDVRPGGRRRWIIDAGPVTVEVLGTRFEVSRSATQVAVRVERGRVRVRGEQVAPRELAAGERFELEIAPNEVPTWDESASAESTSEDASEPIVDAIDDSNVASEPSVAHANSTHDGQTSIADDDADAQSSSARMRAPVANAIATHDAQSSSARARAPVDGWRALAESGDVEAAHRELGSERLLRLSRTTQRPEELFLLADIARRAGSPEEALVPLRRIVSAYPDDPRTALASLTLGRILADRLRRPSEAGDAFIRAVELGLPAALRGTAQHRAVASYRAAGRVADARRAAEAYLRDYPNGPSADELRTWLDQHAP